MKSWTLATRIWTVLALTMIVGLSATVGLLYRVKAAAEAYEHVISGEMHQQALARAIQLDFKKQVQAWKDILLRGSDPASLEKYTGEFRAQESSVRKQARELATLVTDPEAQASLEQFLSEHQQLGLQYSAALKSFAEAKGENPQAVDSSLKGKDRAPTNLLDNVVEQLNRKADQAVLSQRQTQSAVRTFISLGLLVTFAILAVFSVFVIRQVNSTLTRSVGQISEAATQIASAAAQVSSSSLALAQGASEQASSVEETSASAQEVNAMILKSAALAEAMTSDMRSAEEIVRTVNAAVDEMGSTMTELTHSNDQISTIIKVVENIAFQTNILALNAAVEAARAGEAGLGFAVVADEVRTLAKRCAEAAKDTSRLIEESTSKTRQGRGKVDAVTSAMQANVVVSTKLSGRMEEVSSANQQQSKGIDQISTAMTYIDSVTQSTASAAEETASASEELLAQSKTLNDVILSLGALVGSA